MSGPLAGVRVVEMAAVVSAPYASMVLADQGAEVVKIEEPGIGDLCRVVQPAAGGLSCFFVSCNRGKRSVVLDTKQPDGRQAVLDLVARADVFIENYRPGALERLGLGEADLRRVSPDLIHLSVTGFGPTGPYAERRVYDPIIQALTGFAATQLNPEAPIPDLVRNAVCDKATSWTAAQAVTAALFARERGAGGQHIDVPMLDSALAFFWPDGMMGHTMLADDATTGVPLAQALNITHTGDGQLVYFAAGQDQWDGLLRALGREDLLTDPGGDLASRAANLVKAGEMVASTFLKWTTGEILARLEAEGVPCAPVLSLEEVIEDPQIRHNEMITVRTHPTAGPIREVRPAARFSATQPEQGTLAALYGEHTDEVLTGLGYTPERIGALRAAAVIP